jgi:MinD-like ATPase involved in chromosome partitioning or flagellar assembly
MTPETSGTGIQDPFSRLMVVYSPAGGNGKSEIAANLAYQLSKKGRRIWIIDANSYAPTMDLIFNVKEKPDSFIRFIKSPDEKNLPIYPVYDTRDNNTQALFLTPAGKADRITRRDILETNEREDDFIGRLQDAIISNLTRNTIDFCIIDTHPGFERVNNIWFGMTSFLLVVSRLNDLDMRNLGVILQDYNIVDIEKKLVVFNNVHYRDEKASHDLENQEMLEKFRHFIEGDELKKEVSVAFTCNGNICGKVEFYSDPFLYSRELALFQKEGDRKSLFSDIHPEDPFSLTLTALSSFISGMNP